MEKSEILQATAPNAARPTTYFVKDLGNDNKILVTHSGGMMNLKPIEGTHVPNLTWDGAKKWVDGEMIQYAMPEVEPEWRDFILSGLKPGEI